MRDPAACGARCEQTHPLTASVSTSRPTRTQPRLRGGGSSAPAVDGSARQGGFARWRPRCVACRATQARPHDAEEALVGGSHRAAPGRLGDATSANGWARLFEFDFGYGMNSGRRPSGDDERDGGTESERVGPEPVEVEPAAAEEADAEELVDDDRDRGGDRDHR